jgi:acetyl esterase/lipase
MRWKGFIHPDDLDAALQTWLRCVETEEPYDYQYRVVRPGGQLIPVHVQAVPLPSGGFVGYMNATNGANCRFICAARQACALSVA